MHSTTAQQWKRKVQCGNSYRRMLTLFKLWCSLPFQLVWERYSHTSCFSATPLFVTVDSSGVKNPF